MFFFPNWSLEDPNEVTLRLETLLAYTFTWFTQICSFAERMDEDSTLCRTGCCRSAAANGRPTVRTDQHEEGHRRHAGGRCSCSRCFMFFSAMNYILVLVEKAYKYLIRSAATGPSKLKRRPVSSPNAQTGEPGEPAPQTVNPVRSDGRRLADTGPLPGSLEIDPLCHWVELASTGNPTHHKLPWLHERKRHRWRVLFFVYVEFFGMFGTH